jgi:hypothetical protein
MAAPDIVDRLVLAVEAKDGMRYYDYVHMSCPYDYDRYNPNGVYLDYAGVRFEPYRSTGEALKQFDDLFNPGDATNQEEAG